MFSRLIRTGSVRPCPTSVARITAKVRKMIRSRSGKPVGSARAAASETTPRIPAHAMSVRWRASGSGTTGLPGLARRRRIRYGTTRAGKTHTIRARITTSAIAPARTSSSPALRSPSRPRAPGNVSPMRMNTAPLTRNRRICHEAKPDTRTRELSALGAWRPTQIPATTVARTPDSPS
jgi:hypothetical protein